MSKLIFISRHDPNNGQIALARKMGYEGIKKADITFATYPIDPLRDIKKAGITEETISIVAPSYITNKLLNEGYKLIEFVNSPIKREKMVFCCEGAYVYELPRPMMIKNIIAGGKISQYFLQCPLSIEEQVESSLVPEKR